MSNTNKVQQVDEFFNIIFTAQKNKKISIANEILVTSKKEKRLYAIKRKYLKKLIYQKRVLNRLKRTVFEYQIIKKRFLI